MTIGQISLLILAITAILAAVWVTILTWIKRKSQIIRDRMIDECQKSGEKMTIEPQSSLYRGADRNFGNVKGNGVICLTERHILFTKLTGQKIEVPLSNIENITEDPSFRGEIFLTFYEIIKAFHTKN